jgi:tetratricopeptide (TPR) repeat protein
MYPYPAGTLKIWQVVAAFAVLAAVTAVVIAARKRRYLLVGWLWFLGTLVPMIGLVQVGSQAMADRYAYLSFLGLFVMICWGVADWAQSHRIAPSWLASASLAVLVALAAGTYHQAAYWSDNVTLWSHSLQVTDDNFLAEDCLGGAFLERGQLEESIPHFRRAAALHASDPVSILNIAFYEQQHHHLPEAIAQYQKATEITQDARSRASAFSNMGWAYRDLGDLPHARESFQSALSLRPRTILAMVGLGLVAQQMNDPEAAVKAYSDAVGVQPSDVLYILLARALRQAGKPQQAQAAMEQGRRLSQDFAGAQKVVDKLAASPPPSPSH